MIYLIHICYQNICKDKLLTQVFREDTEAHRILESKPLHSLVWLVGYCCLIIGGKKKNPGM